MVIKIISFSGASSDNFKKAIKIRFSVFTEEQNVDKDIDYDGLDFEATHYLVTVDDKPIATARFRETDEGIKIERMAVLKKYRSYGIGNLLIRYIIRDLLPSKRKIYLNSQEHALNFYKSSHFVVEGKPFYEADIKHYKMIYNGK